MKTCDFTTRVTSAKLNENMNKMFGVNVKLENYSREQLEDMRNKLRTRVFQQEGSAGVNDLLTNETYQKDKAMLDLLNTRIKEMLGENIKNLRNKMLELSEAKKGVKAPKYAQKAKSSVKPDFLDVDKDKNKKEPFKKAVADKKVKEGAKPDFLDMDKDGNKKETMKKAIADKKVKEAAPASKKTSSGGVATKTATGTVHKAGPKGYGNKWDGETQDQAPAKASKAAKSSAEKKAAKANDIKLPAWKGGVTKHSSNKGAEKDDGTGDVAESRKASMKESIMNFKHNVKFVNESLGYLINEDEEGKAKAITSAGDMVNDFTSWMQRVGQYQTKTMIELADAIKADFGAAESEAFKQAVGPALSATLEVLTQQREAVSGAVAALAGEAVPDAAMGMEPEMMPSPEMDVSAPDEMNPPDIGGDEFGASDAAAGAGTPGREMRESKFARRLAESHSIMNSLSK
jgi:hypothetical protein